MSSSRQQDKDGFYPGSAWNPRLSDDPKPWVDRSDGESPICTRRTDDDQ